LNALKSNKTKLDSFGVQRFGLFGSFLHNQVNDQSDVDLIVEFKPGQKNFANFSNLIFYLEDLFGRPVEVITPESLSPYIGPRILGEVEHVEISD
jgi:predicted nucleotidyltransferase